VREIFGYDRLESKLITQLMNNVYRKEWRLLSNYFYPQIRLKSKERHGAKVKRTFYPPATPFEILKKFLTPEKLKQMEEEYASLDPFKLRKQLKIKLRDFQAYNSRPRDALGKYAV